MMHASLPASGWHCRPVMTLPLAMIGPALERARFFASITAVSQTMLPVWTSTA